ncbi:glycosyltransferase family 2 protein [Bacillus luteolus]|uniref:Glycosyltransferase family 2 protein n=1 Tax=Litchfieldia luteola TaxID=682179 RepID=A0ABR9QGN5_9BACI|nr:glycosyltransferase [Cytobacillus luteolus]MBE4907645.1 glycosyltransferase family 2 protein [Cytobacillus luteolus]MBP1941096.1 biofilm PGA synthesis N-glycosyltransferase PgaC [Cytobacillus luteolus]
MFSRTKPIFIFSVSLLLATEWMLFSFFFDLPWIREISHYIPYPLALAAVFGLAIIPGFIFVFLMVSLLLDPRRPNTKTGPSPNLSVLIAAYNEEKYIETTIQKILSCHYNGKIELIVINDGSTDRTGEILADLELKYPKLKVILQKENQGKSAALNRGLCYASYDYIVTVDADTWLHQKAFSKIVKPLQNSSQKIGAVAGSIMVNNPKQSWITKLQVWDYLLSIAAVKSQQSLYKGTLVAQGAFSLYHKEAIIKAGGWKSVVGEDIVLTWGILENNYIVDYVPTAIGFTYVPTKFKKFFNQRKRWARGLFEAFRAHPMILVKYKGLSKFNIFLNLFFPLIDLAIIFVFVPGIILALFFQFYLIVGLLTLLVLPFSLLLSGLMYHRQRTIFKLLNIPIYRQFAWGILFLLTYPLLQAPASLAGYIEELLSLKKRW